MDIFKTLILDTPDTLSNISGILPVSNGGTGADNAPDARVNLLPSYTGNANKVLSLNGGATDVEWTSNGAGDVVGPASATDENIAVYNATTGKLIKDGGSTIAGVLSTAAAVLSNVTNDAQLKIASNLADLDNAATARSSLGLGNSATLNVGTTAGTVAAGDDSRFLGGDVVGPASSTDNAVVRYDGTTGKLVQNSAVTIDDSGKVSVGTNAAYGAPVAQFNGANVAITNTAGQFSIGTTDTAAADLGGSLGFTANTTTLAGYPMGSISGRLIATGAGVYRSYMAFATTDAAGSVAERMRLTDAGLNVTGVLGVTQQDSAYTYIRGATKAVRFRASPNGTFIEGVDNTITSSYEPLLIGGSTLDFQIQSSTKMLIDSSGNVGIGTSPTEKLEVAGNVRLDASNAELNIAAGTTGTTGAINFTFTSEDTNYAGMEFVYDTRSTVGPRFYSKDGYGLTIDSGDDLHLRTDGVDKLTILNNGNVGIGTTSPGSLLTLSADAAHEIQLNRTGANPGVCKIENSGNLLILSNDVSGIDFKTGSTPSRKMRINSGGDVFMHGTTINGTENDAGYSVGGLSFRVSRDTTANANQIVFYNPNGAVGAIKTNGSATTYNTSSDYRLKENVVPMQDALQRITQLKPSRFNFIADDSVVVDGFIAHEVQEVVPEAISGEKDAMQDEEYEATPAVLDDDGNEITPAVMDTRSVPEYQGIDQSKLVPLLVGAIQELTARIAALENN